MADPSVSPEVCPSRELHLCHCAAQSSSQPAQRDFRVYIGPVGRGTSRREPVRALCHRRLLSDVLSRLSQCDGAAPQQLDGAENLTVCAWRPSDRILSISHSLGITLDLKDRRSSPCSALSRHSRHSQHSQQSRHTPHSQHSQHRRDESSETSILPL